MLVLTRACTRKMKMANGGYDPAYSVQLAPDADSRMIVGLEVINAGTDGGELATMQEKVRSDYGKIPRRCWWIPPMQRKMA